MGAGASTAASVKDALKSCSEAELKNMCVDLSPEDTARIRSALEACAAGSAAAAAEGGGGGASSGDGGASPPGAAAAEEAIADALPKKDQEASLPDLGEDANEEGLKKTSGSDVSDELNNDIRLVFEHYAAKTRTGNTIGILDFNDLLKKVNVKPARGVRQLFNTIADEDDRVDAARFLEWAIKSKLDCDKIIGSREQRQMLATNQLFAAVKDGRVAEVAALLKRRADPNALGEYRRTALQCLCYSDSQAMECLTALLQARADVNLKGELGETALHSFCSDMKVDLARCVIDAKADVNATDDKGRPPWLLVDKKEDGAKSLLQLLKDSGCARKGPARGCDPDACDPADRAHILGTALPAAVQAGDLDLVNLLLKQLNGELDADCGSKVLCSLPQADEKAACACARELLAAKASVNGRQGNRPVKLMSEAGCWGVVQLLLDARADLNVKNVEEYFDNGPRARFTHPIYWDVKGLAEKARAEEVLAAIARRGPPPAEADEMSFAERFA